MSPCRLRHCTVERQTVSAAPSREYSLWALAPLRYRCDFSVAPVARDLSTFLCVVDNCTVSTLTQLTDVLLQVALPDFNIFVGLNL